MGHRFDLEKQPAEKLTIAVDFTEDLGSSETISGTEILALDLNDGSDASSTILEGSAQILDGDQTASRIAQKVKAGSNGKRYKITLRATTSASHIFEADVIMTIREL